jgi:hypothetical protein
MRTCSLHPRTREAPEDLDPIVTVPTMAPTVLQYRRQPTGQVNGIDAAE